MNWKNEKRKIKDLMPQNYNPRVLTDKQKKELKESIKEFGQVVPIVINTNGNIIGGHQRITIYSDLGIEEADVMVPSRKLTEKEERRLNLRLNKNQGQWDYEKLKEFDIETLLDVGFDDDELSGMWDDTTELEEDQFDVEKEIAKIKTPSVKYGELYQLGNHVLMCGDARKEEDVKKLMGENLADMAYSDPPYNISVDYNRGIGGNRKKYGGKYKDKMTDEDYAEFIDATIKNTAIHSKPDFHLFMWSDESNSGVIQDLFKQNEISPERLCLWVKNNFFPKPEVAFSKICEFCVYGKRGNPYLNRTTWKNPSEILNKDIGTGNQTAEDILEIINIWLARKDNTQHYDHPTQKPISLHEKPIKRCTKPGDIVMDLFAGSGSTLMSCEQLKRKCYTMEIDPVFCQLVINRFEHYAGQTSKRIN